MSVYPSEAKYKRVENFNDKVMSRQTTKISPFNASIFGPKNVDRLLFNIPSEQNKSIDMDTLMVHWDAQLDVGTGNVYTNFDTYFLNSIESVISALRIRKGTSFLLEDIRNYSYIDSLLMSYVNRAYNDAFGAACMGIGSSNERILLHPSLANNLSKVRSYVVPLRLSGISNYSGLIDSGLIDPVSCFQIEIELTPASDALVSYGINTGANLGVPNTNANYYLNNCYLTYDTVTMVPEYYNAVQQTISRGIPLQIPYKTFRSSIYNLPASTPSIVYNINDSVKSLNSIIVGFFKQDEQGRFNVSGKDRKHWIPTLKTAQLQLGSQYYPLQPLSCNNGAPQCFIELQKALGLSFLRSENSGPFSFKGFDFSTASYGNTFDLLTGFVANTPVPQFTSGNTSINSYTVGAKMTAGYGKCVRANDADFGDPTNPLTNNDGVRFMREVACGNACEGMIGFNLKKVLDISEGDIVGSDVASSGSGLMSLRLDFDGNSGANTYNVIIVSLYDAVLEIQSNSQSFRIE